MKITIKSSIQITCLKTSSDVALEVALLQGEICYDLLITNTIKAFLEHDKKEPILEKELLEIHWGINYFKPYIFRAKFIVVTDHRLLFTPFKY